MGKELQSDITENSLCLISGETTYTYILTYMLYFYMYLYAVSTGLAIFFEVLYHFLPLEIIGRMLNFWVEVLVYSFDKMEFIIIDSNANQRTIFGSNIHLGPSEGWIKSIGLNGKKDVNGTIWGQIPMYDYPFDLGVIGFSGIQLMLDSETLKHFFMGTAMRLIVGPEPPYN